MISKQKNNILLVANYPSNVGYAWWLMENFWAEIANYFSKYEINTYLIFPKLNSVPRQIKNSSAILIEHDFDDMSAEGFQKLKNLINKYSISNIYLTDKPYYNIYYHQLRRIGIKKIVVHDHTPGERTKPNWLLFSLKKILFSIPQISCDKYIGVSKFVYNRLTKTTGIPLEKCTYVLNGIEPIEIEEKKVTNIRTELHLPANAIIIASTGRATGYKGIDFVIRCADQLINTNCISNIYFIHCGDGPSLNSFKQLVKEFQLEKFFYLLGNRTDVPQLLLSCDIAFHASKGEAFSLSILEYLSASLATVAPDNCGNGEAITHKKSGLLYTPADINSATHHLQHVIENPQLRKRLGIEGRQSVKEHFSLSRANKELLLILNNVFIG